MKRSVLAGLILAIAFCCSPLFGQDSPAKESADLKVELRSATGSNRFQLGEVIPLEVLISSQTPKRYLEPCKMFWESCFGYPQCRFFTHWSFDVIPATGWTDIGGHGCMTMSGPTFDVQSSDLTVEPKKYSYTLTNKFRFDKPGEYHVRLSLDVGLIDETTQPKPATDPAVKPHAVTVTPEIVLQIVPASSEWQKEVIRNGQEAYSGVMPRSTNPPSPEMLRYQQATQALCNLGTPEAARVLVNLLSLQHQDIQYCLDRTPSSDAAIREMERLLVDPDSGVNSFLFSELVRLVGRAEFEPVGAIAQEAVDRERQILLSALPQKRGAAEITSLLTALQWPPHAKGTPFDMGYDLPFPDSVIASVVGDFDSFPRDRQEWLLGDTWPRVRSPLMLPLVRRLADAGNGQALLRWMELDPIAAAEFARKEIARPVPRFSSFYLRLPDSSLAGREAQLAANFVALTRDEDLIRAATLLHSYATSAVLPVVLPFIDAHRAQWSCSVLYPVLAFLLKVSPEEAAPRVEQALEKINHEPWQPTFFTVIGYLEPSPVLERLAMEEIKAGTQSLAADATDYLRLHGTATAKPFVWKQLVRWREEVAATRSANGANKRAIDGPPTPEEYFQGTLADALVGAFVHAQGWIVTPEDADRLEALLGKQSVAQMSCTFSCSSALGIGPTPATYAIYSSGNDPRLPNHDPEYMNPEGRHHYSINQYRCADMRALKEKILQFPVGSSFDFAWYFSAADRDELVEISDFLWSHGYKVRNPQNWSFLRPDSR